MQLVKGFLWDSYFEKIHRNKFVGEQSMLSQKKFDHEYLIGSLTYKDPIKHPWSNIFVKLFNG